jgi:hypothetical protein
MRRIKKAPEKAHVPGGQRTRNLSGSDWTQSRLRAGCGRKSGCVGPDRRRECVVSDRARFRAARAAAMVINEGDVFFVDNPTTWLRMLICVMYCFVQTLSTATAKLSEERLVTCCEGQTRSASLPQFCLLAVVSPSCVGGRIGQCPRRVNGTLNGSRKSFS